MGTRKNVSPMAAQCVCQPARRRVRGSGGVPEECGRNLHANAAESGPAAALNGPAQLCFGVFRALLRDNAPVRRGKLTAIGANDVGIDTTLYGPYVDRWMRNARNVKSGVPSGASRGVVDAFQNNRFAAASASTPDSGPLPHGPGARRTVISKVQTNRCAP